VSETFDPFSRPVAMAVRFILWLAWEVLVLTVPWYVGWPIWRVVSLGRFPGIAIGDQEQAGTLETVLVWGTGLLVIGAVAWALSGAPGGT